MSSLSIVMPAYNEAVRLATSLPIVVDYLGKHWPESELIIVDDGSTDETAAVAHD